MCCMGSTESPPKKVMNHRNDTDGVGSSYTVMLLEILPSKCCASTSSSNCFFQMAKVRLLVLI